MKSEGGGESVLGSHTCFSLLGRKASGGWRDGNRSRVLDSEAGAPCGCCVLTLGCKVRGCQSGIALELEMFSS